MPKYFLDIYTFQCLSIPYKNLLVNLDVEPISQIRIREIGAGGAFGLPSIFKFIKWSLPNNHSKALLIYYRPLKWLLGTKALKNAM